MRVYLKKIVATGLMFTALASSFIAEAEWTGVAVKRTTAYTNAALTTKNGVEYVDAGDTITVLQETGNAYFVRYPLARGGYKERWVSKDVFGNVTNSSLGTSAAASAVQVVSNAYAQWQGVANKRATAYTNAALTSRNGVEYVDAGDTVTVLNESGNAYYVRYPLARGGYKERWVSKSAVSRSGAVATNIVGAATAAAAAKAISQAPSTTAANYQQWQGYSPNRLTVYTNAALTARNANEWVDAGDTVTVLQESGNAYYVRYPLTRGGYKERWVSKNGIQRTASNNVGSAIASAAAAAKAISQAPSTTAANYQQWQGYSPNRLTAYTNAALTARNANEWVDAGDTVTVLQESGNAYYVRYPLTRGGYKDRWVNKNGIQRVTATQSNGIRANGLEQAAKQQEATRNAALSLSRNTATVSDYQQWQGYSPNRLTAYTNSALTTRNPNEWVDAGDTVTVLKEEGNAYFVSYPLMKGGTKERWVNKRGILKTNINNGNINQSINKVTNNMSINNNSYVYPVEGNYRLTTLFYYNGIKKKMRNPHMHSVWWNRNTDGHFKAMDIACSGGTPVKAVAGGTVVTTPETQNVNHIIVIDHGNEKSLYAHLRKINFGVGDRVEAGWVIGESGDVGATGSYHLHLEFMYSSPWEYFRDKVPFQYCSSTKSAYNNWCEPDEKQRFKEAIDWVENHKEWTKGFIY